jgi:hypothetical protein
MTRPGQVHCHRAATKHFLLFCRHFSQYAACGSPQDYEVA